MGRIRRNLTYIDRIKTAWAILQNIEVLDAVLVKIEALSGILDRLSTIERTLCANETLLSLAGRIEALDSAVRKIEMTPRAPLDASNGTVVHPVKQDLLEWNRLKLLAKFVQLADKGKEIELEWQRIQQDEHDYKFAFDASPNDDTQGRFLFKKGIAEGVKWCVNRFS